MSSSEVFNLDKEMADIAKDYRLTFEELQNLSINVENELKRYLFRGWFMSTICEEKSLDSCPCCGRKID